MRLEAPGLEPLDLVDDGDGDFVLGQWELSHPDIRTVADPRPGADGETDRTAHFGGRVLTMQLRVRPGPGRQARLDRFRAFCHPATRAWVYWDEGAGERRIQARADTHAAPISSPGSSEIAAAWRCPSPFAEAATPTAAWIRPIAAAPGRAYTRSYPRVYPTGGSAGVDIVNDGNMPADWVARIFGVCTNPILTNTRTGQSLSFTSLTIPTNDFLEIDSRAKTIRLNGLAGANRFHLLNPTSDWFAILPGVNPIVFSATTPSAPCQTELIYRDTYL